MYTVFCIQYYCPITVSLYPVGKDCQVRLSIQQHGITLHKVTIFFQIIIETQTISQTVNTVAEMSNTVHQLSVLDSR